MRRVFTDAGRNERYLSDGYVVLDMLDSEACRAGIAAYEAIHSSRPQGAFFASTHSADAAYRRRCNEAITSILTPYTLELLDDYRPLYANFMVKPPGAGSECGLHQDWTFVDEGRYRTVNVWVALEDTDLTNGCIHLIPRSQRLPFPYRGRNVNPVYGDAVSLMTSELLLPVPLRQGQCVVFDSAILHYSPDNRSARERIALSLMLYPADAPVVHYVYDKGKPNHVTKYHVTPDFFVQYGSAEDYTSPGGQSQTVSADPVSFASIRDMLMVRGI